MPKYSIGLVVLGSIALYAVLYARPKTDLVKADPDRSSSEPSVAVKAPKLIAPKTSLQLAKQKLKPSSMEAPTVAASAPREPTIEDLERDQRSAPEPLDPEELIARATERKLLVTRWEGQSTDPKWSDQTVVMLEDLLTRSNFSPNAFHDLDCRKTICRFLLEGENSRDALDLIHIARSVHGDTWLDHREQEDGSWEIEVFFSQVGYMLSGSGERIPNAG
jgi:hypothetical protein